MKYIDLFESKNKPCIVVDVQPEYAGVHDGQDFDFIDDLMEFLNNQTGPILIFVNAEEHGLTPDTIDDVRIYWEDSGFNPENWNRAEVIDKGYGYLRSWMDHPATSETDIVKTLRYMYQNRLQHSDEIPFEDFKQLVDIEQMNEGDIEDLYYDPLEIYWANVGELKAHSPAYLMGGGVNECLAEVRLLMNAFNIKYTIIDKFTYGHGSCGF